MTILTGPTGATLRASRDLVRPELQRAVSRLDAYSASVASYHFGWTDAEGRPTGTDGSGKAVRPALALLSARAGGCEALGVPAAVAVELVHNFSLLHDDLMDGDLERRHRPTVWAQFGTAAAVLVGDAMLTLAQQVLLAAPSSCAEAATRMLADATQELVRGQAEDLAFERRATVGVQECLRMAAGKTGALLAASAAVGAVLAGAPQGQVAALWAFGSEVGLAFQLVDDLLGIWGDPATTGKPVLSDLRSRKKSLPVAYALSSAGTAARELQDWLAAPQEHTEADLRRAATLVEAAGGRRWAAEEAERRLAKAERALHAVPLPAEVCAELLALGRFIVRRDS